MKEANNFRKLLLAILLLNINMMIAQDKNTGSTHLNAHQQSMASICALSAVGNIQKLKTELNTGLDSGLSVNEIKEALVQLYAYCGFPRSLNAINAFMEVLENRKADGITDLQGKEASPINATNDKYSVGKETLQKLTGKEEKGPKTGANAFAPAIDVFLKEHLFADIFSRDVLNYRQREFVTISILSAMSRVEPQLQAHISMGLNTGITEGQIMELSAIIEKQIGKEQAEIVKNALEKVIQINKKIN
ncbi:carboxymuconolactone decarboxylase family protein [Flavobacterium chungbukense]|uniref:Carboxymuconolactone decarboxylase family protein n=1 Tax=Flavobacterium chungbukense TaxID=877464 RepID=A0ABP7XLW4_9FLAO|nr:carboxymuconolactone decarboxylase family protein [Flavobacterium chungbukense]MCC4920704.1 carboxymuconolactone decarboxylase family protein [Flavobacterium chungbukense]